MADIAINSGWLLYCNDSKGIVQLHKKLKVFKLEVVGVLIHGGKKKGRSPEGREVDVQTEGAGSV